MKEIIVSVVLIIFGLFILLVWYAGSHGNISFRPGTLDYWAFAGPVFICFAIPLFFLLRYAWRRLRRNGK